MDPTPSNPVTNGVSQNTTSQTNSIPPHHDSQATWSVDAALAALSLPSPSTAPTTPIPFLHFIRRLKTTPRAGWLHFGIPQPESISDHMYRMAIITLLAPPSLKQRLDLDRCTKMALLHDMAESLVGDITPREKVAKIEKSRRESTTMEWLTQHLLGDTASGMNDTGAELMKLWQEYEDDDTAEAHFVHDVDKFELILQMMEYERDEAGKKDLGEFAGVLRSIRTREVAEWALDVVRERKEFWGKKYEGVQGREHEEDLARRFP